MGCGRQLVGVWPECPASAKIKTAKISSEESGPFSVKICTSENFLLYGRRCFVQCWTFYWCYDDVDPHQMVMRLHNHVVWLVTLPFLTLCVVNWSIHSYSVGKLTIKMGFVTCHLCRQLPSSYSLSLVHSEHVNTQWVCHKQWYIQS